ncbi:hypothetical protein EV363DRAFT_1406510 [Boletus edulis]|nr:hypothetical protein EV363DRAFT_1406510 [Boletus edulis]
MYRSIESALVWRTIVGPETHVKGLEPGRALETKEDGISEIIERGPGMAEAKTANVIEWAQGQMIYEMTERVERAEVWPRHGQPRGPKHGRGKESRHIRVGPGPENVFDYRKDREGPSVAKDDRNGGEGLSMAEASKAEVIKWAQSQRTYKMTDVMEWAQCQRIYKVTERIQKAQAWPRQGQAR